MTTLREAAANLLNALEASSGTVSIDQWVDMCRALRAALAEPHGEPVAWMVYTLDGKSVFVTDSPADFTPEHRALPLYTRSST